MSGTGSGPGGEGAGGAGAGAAGAGSGGEARDKRPGKARREAPKPKAEMVNGTA